MGKLGSDGNQIERNVSSSEAIDPSSNLVSNLELVSESSCDVFSASVMLRFNLLRVEICELRPEVVAGGDDVPVPY